ncbi:MAG: hypothetical protein QM597_06790 [Aeromicrobium sp.]|uniref:hypothetical protein n=1 Tax=Aeromicrobium sp. TaxID=1871063 RepID=UPI0039E3638F
MAFTLLAAVAGLPEGPATEATVRTQLRIDPTDHTDDAALELAVNAVNAFVVGLPVVVDGLLPGLPDPLPASWTWPPRLTQGATLLAARIFRRRNSAEGVTSFGDSGVVYVRRNDPDVAMLLRLGDYAPPTVA